jgi:hypothetical protein
MHTIQVIAGGLLLLIFCVAAGRLVRAKVATSIRVFYGLWLFCALVNMWLGVTRAGHSIPDELPYFLIVFFTPMLVGIGVNERQKHIK